MIIRAKIGFAGVLTMRKGETKEYNDEVVLQDLLKAGYIEEVKEETPESGEEVKEEVKEEGSEATKETEQKPKKAVKASEGK